MLAHGDILLVGVLPVTAGRRVFLVAVLRKVFRLLVSVHLVVGEHILVRTVVVSVQSVLQRGLNRTDPFRAGVGKLPLRAVLVQTLLLVEELELLLVLASSLNDLLGSSD